MGFINRTIGEGIIVGISTSDINADRRILSRLIITAEYHGYMHSDPILKLSTSPVTPGSWYVRYGLTLSIDPDVINNNITAFNFWVSNNPEELETHEEWTDDYLTYHLMGTIKTGDAEEWSIASGEAYPNSASITIEGKTDTHKVSLLRRLNREPIFEREYLKPRYIRSAQRGQGSVIVVDQDDTMLRLSTYNGLDVHEDENFPNITDDFTGRLQRLPLTGSGEMLGLEIMNDRIFVFRETELEVVDMQSGVSDKIAIDCVAKRSIVKTPYGIVWAGKAGIYLLPSAGGSIEPINPLWRDYYNGTERTGSGLSIIDEKARKDIIAGYNPFSHEVWFNIDWVVDV